MQKLRSDIAGVVSSIIVSCSFFSTVFAELPQTFIDSTNSIIDTLRKRECVLKILSPNHIIANKEVKIKQIRNDFGFGASITKKFFTKNDSARYTEAFKKYFEWATPENEMKWPQTDQSGDYQDFELADSLVSWCQKNDIKVRGHNLFWNERKEWMPSWAVELSQADFKAAMALRIDSVVAHFKGRVAHWDVINEVVHYKDTSGIPQTKKPGLLAQYSGDDNIFSWIFKRARSIDSSVVMAVNEYSVIEKLSDTKQYIEAIKDIENNGGKVDVIGLEGHFDDYVERSKYMERIDTIAKSLPQQMWLTEVDFTLASSYSERADKMEELIRSAFAYPRMGGFVLWAWWEGNQWKPTLSSFVVDSNLIETEIGARWRALRDGWRTNLTQTTNANGEVSFKGFHGKYVATVQYNDSLYSDTFYVEPGKSTKSVSINLEFRTGILPYENAKKSNGNISFNGKEFTIPTNIDMNHLFFSVYTLSGRLINKMPVLIKDSRIIQPSVVASGIHLIQISSGNKVLFSDVESKY
jgi:GH35 family endo-1,4-beta-xylanase